MRAPIDLSGSRRVWILLQRLLGVLIVGALTCNFAEAKSIPANASPAQRISPAAVPFFRTYHDGARTLIRWRTSFEVGLLSFDLYRLGKDGEWFKLNSDTILGNNVLAGASYEIIDPGPKGSETMVYKLIGFDQQGLQHELGVFRVRPAEELPPVTSPVTVVSKTELPSAPSSAGPSIAAVELTDLNGGTFVKVSTTNTGLQVLSANSLAAVLGVSVSSVQSAILQQQLHLTNRGQSVGWMPASGGSALLFWAQAYKDNYTDRNVFWLTSGTDQALPSSDGQSPAANLNATSYPARVEQERDLVSVTTLPINPDDDYWMWTRLVAGLSLNDTATYPVTLDHVASGTNVSGQFAFHFWGGNTAAHRAQIKINGQIITNADWSGITDFHLDLTVPSTLLTNGSNFIVIKALVNGSTSPRSQWYVNRFAMTYPRQFFAQAGMVEFTANSNSVISLSGFANSAITVLDLSNTNIPVIVTNLNIEQLASTNYRASFVANAPDTHYIAFQSGAGISVDSLKVATVAGLSDSTNAARYVLISPESLLTAATNLASYRQQKGLPSRIAPLDSIYNEFAYGFATPHAIQAFLAMAYTNWNLRPQYAVLLGDGTYDYRNLQTNGDNLMPPLLISTAYGLFASDSAFADVTGDNLPDLAIGRLSGNNSAEVMAVIDKVKSYEAQSLPAQAQTLLIADTPGEAGDFNEDIQTLDGVLSNKFQNTLLRRSDQPDSDTMTSLLTNVWNQGVDFVSYSGHGAVDRFGNSGYLTSNNSSNLNSTRIPLVVATTCVAGQFSVPGTDCLAEFLQKKVPGGAIAIIAPTGLSLDNEAARLNVRLCTLLKENSLPAIGDMFRQGLVAHIREDNPTIPTTIYNLLGDPATHYNTIVNFLPPSAMTQAAVDITTNSATLQASVIPNRPAGAYFEYGLTASYGSFTATNFLDTTNVSLAISNGISDLAPGTAYHFRVVAWNEAGTNAGADIVVVSSPLAPVIMDQGATDLTNNSATLFSSINPYGAPTRVYFEYGADINYGSVSATNILTGTNTFATIDTDITGLLPGIGYHFRAVAINTAGTTFGSDHVFSMPALSPIATTMAASGVTSNQATLHSLITANGAPTTVYFEYGTDASYGSFSTTNFVSASDVSALVSATISGMSFGQVYHFRVVAENDVGLDLGADAMFVTSPVAPVITAEIVTGLTNNAPTLFASVNPSGALTLVYFEFGTDTNYGSFSATNILAGTNIFMPVTAAIPGLAPGVFYHFHAVAMNGIGTSVGSDHSFFMPALSPVATTIAASDVTLNQATLQGLITPNGATTMVYFEYGTDVGYGNFSATNLLSRSDISGSASAIVLGLSPGELYHFRVIAANNVGTNLGGDLTFVTPESAPSIVTQPTSQEIWEGENVTFVVSATAASPLAYQWYFQDEAMATQTNATLTLQNVTTNQSGSYFVTVMGNGGTTNSLDAMLVVTPPHYEISSLALSDDSISFSWRSIIGRQYGIDGTTDLTNWTTLTTLTAVTTNTAFSTRLNFIGQFFRIYPIP